MAEVLGPLHLLVAVTVGTEPASVGYFNVTGDNDGAISTSADRDYTYGLKLRYATEQGEVGWINTAVELLGMGASPRRARAGVTVGHAFFTPSDLERVDPDPEDRPYAGWLYAEGSLWGEGLHDHASGLRDRSLMHLGLSLGVVGPASGASALQKAWHDLLDVGLPYGWGYQLKNEFTVMVSGEYKRRFNRRIWRWMEVDVTPGAGLSIGNVLTHAALSAEIRLGYNMVSDWGPARPFFPVIDESWGWYVFAGAEGRAVLQNLFLDGNTFGGSRSVDKRSFVGDAVFGVALTVWRIRLAYTVTVRSPEIKARSDPHAFASISGTLAI